MGMSIHIHMLYGVKIPTYISHKKTKNPLFGVHKYNPSNGKLVTEYITEKLDLDKLADDFRLIRVSGTYRENGETEEFIGIETVSSLSPMYEEDTFRVIRELTVESMKAWTDRINKMCETIQLVPEINHYVIVNISC